MHRLGGGGAGAGAQPKARLESKNGGGGNVYQLFALQYLRGGCVDCVYGVGHDGGGVADGAVGGLAADADVVALVGQVGG